MPTLIDPEEIKEHQSGEGWRIVTLADGGAIGAPAMLARRWYLDPAVKGPVTVHGDQEQLLYVIKGSGAALVDRSYHYNWNRKGCRPSGFSQEIGSG